MLRGAEELLAYLSPEYERAYSQQEKAHSKTSKPKQNSSL
jgi:hypothetical protein